MTEDEASAINIDPSGDTILEACYSQLQSNDSKIFHAYIIKVPHLPTH